MEQLYTFADRDRINLSAQRVLSVCHLALITVGRLHEARRGESAHHVESTHRRSTTPRAIPTRRAPQPLPRPQHHTDNHLPIPASSASTPTTRTPSRPSTRFSTVVARTGGLFQVEASALRTYGSPPVPHTTRPPFTTGEPAFIGPEMAYRVMSSRCRT